MSEGYSYSTQAEVGKGISKGVYNANNANLVLQLQQNRMGACVVRVRDEL